MLAFVVVVLLQGTHQSAVGPQLAVGDEFEQRPALDRASPVADGAAGDGQIAGAGLRAAGDESAALPDVSWPREVNFPTALFVD